MPPKEGGVFTAAQIIYITLCFFGNIHAFNLFFLFASDNNETVNFTQRIIHTQQL